MKLSKFRIRSPQAVFALLAVLGSVGTVQAGSPLLSATPSTVNLYCSATNPGYPVTVTLKPVGAVPTTTPATTFPISLASTPIAGVTVAVVGTATAITATNATAGINYTFTPTAACTTGAGQTYTFRVAPTTSGTAVADVQVTVNVTKANFLTTATPTITLSCVNPASLSPVSVVLKAANTVPANYTLTPVLPSAPTGFTVAAAGGAASNITPANTTTVGINYTFTPLAVCTLNSQPFSSQTYTFKAATTGTTAAAAADLAVTVVTISSLASPLVAPAVTLNCTLNGGTYGAAPTGTLSVSSAFPLSTTYTVTTATVPGWLTVGTPTGQTTPNTNSLTVAANCGTFAGGTSNKANIHLASTSGTITFSDYVVVVTLNIVSPTQLSVTSPVSMTYTQKSGTPGSALVPVTVSSGPQLLFMVDTTTLPIWATVDTTSAMTPASIRFTTTAAADQEAPGAYSQNVHLKVQGQADTVLALNIQINSPTAHITVSSANTTANWTLGNSTIPSATITLVSSGGAVPYSIATSGILTPPGTAIAADLASGLAYGFGVTIPITYSQAAFASAQAGAQLTGMATITWGSPAVTNVVAFTVTVGSPTPTLTSIWPSSLPTATPGTTQNLTLTGSGFIKSQDPTVATQVGISVSGAYTPSAYLTATVTDSSHINLAIVVPPGGTSILPFDTATNAIVILSVCNPVSGVCNIVNPGSTASFTIGSLPSISAITSSSAFILQTTVAPYDIVSLFGYNFCPTCSTSYVMLGSPDANLVYPQTLSDGGQTPKLLSVTFAETTTPNTIAQASLLFGTDSQINLLVPGALAGYGGTVNITVTAGGVTSAPFPVTITASDPGIFTVGSSGQGDGAILSQAYTLVSQANPAAVRQASGGGANLSDNIQIYMSGLGAPWAGVANNNASAAAGNAITNNYWSGDCISTTSFLVALNAPLGNNTYSTIDGVVIQSRLLNSLRLPPCLGNNVTTPIVSATFGGIAGTVTYAGWVADSVEGLYQVNVQLPSSTALTVTAATREPVVVKVGGAGGVSSQAGVTVWVAPMLTVAAPATELTGPIGSPWPTDTNAKVIASGGSPAYRYTLTSGQLPLGLSFNSDGSISGTPALLTSGSYQLTVTATDSATIPVSGTVTFTITVTGGLVMTSSNSGPFSATFNSASPSITTITPTGGIAGGYTFGLVSATSHAAVTGLGIDTFGVISSLATTKAGVYNMTATAHDTSTPSPLTGAYNFTLNVALSMPVPTATPQPTGTPAGVLATVVATGNTGTIVYSLDSASTSEGFTIDSSSGAVKVSTAPALANWTVVVTATDGTLATGASAVGTATVSFNVSTLMPQTIAFGGAPSPTFDGTGSQTVTVSATATSGLTVTFTSATPGVCTAAGTTVTIVSPGTCTIHATQAGNTTYAAATMASQNFTVNAEAQTITFGTAPVTQTFDGSGTQTVTVSATATSTLTVSFASATPGVCTASGTSGTVTIISPGTCTIHGSQAGNATYAAATMASQNFTVNAEAQTISFTGPGDQVLSTGSVSVSASSTSGLTVTFSTSSSSSICTVSGTTVTLQGDGACVVKADQTGNSTYGVAPSVNQTINITG